MNGIWILWIWRLQRPQACRHHCRLSSLRRTLQQLDRGSGTLPALLEQQNLFPLRWLWTCLWRTLPDLPRHRPCLILSRSGKPAP